MKVTVTETELHTELDDLVVRIRAVVTDYSQFRNLIVISVLCK
jgi:hypothetical protein